MHRTVLVLVLGIAVGWTHESYAENKSSEADVLIGQLVGNSPKGNEKLSADPPAQIAKAKAKLIALGTTAFPSLIAHRHDRRYSYTIGGEGLGNAGPREVVRRDQKVGDVCVGIIGAKFNFDHEYQGSVKFIPDVVAVEDLPDWWKAHCSDSLSQLRKEAIKGTIAKEKERSARTPTLGALDRLGADRAAQLEVDLQAMESK